MEKILYKTIAGSRLYGLSHPDSDYDYYVVIDEKEGNRRYNYAYQEIRGKVDTLTIDLPTWLRHCENGNPQALEAMFSTMPVEDEMSWFRSQFYAGLPNMRKTYEHVIGTSLESDTYKSRRHALRLHLNLREASRSGRFNPTLTPEQVKWVNFAANASRLAIERLILKEST